MPAIILVFIIFFLSGCGSQNGADTPFVKEPETAPSTTASPTSTEASNLPSTAVCKYDANAKTWSSIDPDILENHANGERFFAKGGGCVNRALIEAWAATHRIEGVKWRDGDITGLAKVEDPNSSLFFEASYSAGPAIFKQKWVMGFLNLFQGKPESTNKVEIQYQKIRGTKYITYWKGKILLETLSENITSVLIENEIEGTQIGMEKAEGGIRDLLKNLREQPPEWKYLKATN